MSGSHHIWCHLPNGPVVVADYREPVIRAMRRTNDLMVVWRKPPRPSDVAAILAWYQDHAVQSANCQAGSCGHTVD